MSPLSEFGLGPHHLAALHRPLRTPAQAALNSYAFVEGDISSRVLVARYAHLWEAAPVWHVAVMIRTPEGPPKERADWTRRDRRRAERTADALIAKVGSGPIWNGPEAGMHAAITEHRLRRLKLREELHLPQGNDVPIIDLYPPLLEVPNE